MKNIRICIVGLGYVGLPIAMTLSKKFQVIGYDINKQRINELKNKIDSTNEVKFENFNNYQKKIRFTFKKKDIQNCNFFIITVPTPVNKLNKPDLSFLKSATNIVSECLKKKDVVVYESTTYPGCTDEICIPLLENKSKMRVNRDFYCGYSPERINPGDKIHKLEKINKIISATNSKGLKIIKFVYKNVTKKKIITTKSIKIAEGAKIIENTQRDINIALMNELSMLFNKLNIDFSEVLKAAKTKWNFLNFKPGLVGGHCIGVDPYYLAHRARTKNFNTKIILSGRMINENMHKYLVKNFEKKFKSKKKYEKKNILLIGMTFKENVPDCRNSQSLKIATSLKKKYKNVYLFDPLINHSIEGCITIKNFNNLQKYKNFFDGLIILVSHKEIINKGKNFFIKLCKKDGIFFDIKNIFKNYSDFKF